LILILNAAAVGHGANTNAINNIEIKMLICAIMGKPLPAIDTALLAKINTGTYKGKTSRDKIMPPRRNPTVNATPIAPIRLSTGVPNSKVNNKIPMD
jgi:hypothetical protein